MQPRRTELSAFGASLCDLQTPRPIRNLLNSVQRRMRNHLKHVFLPPSQDKVRLLLFLLL